MTRPRPAFPWVLLIITLLGWAIFGAILARFVMSISKP